MRLLQLAAFFSSFDRFVVAPMLVTVAAALGASLAETTATASLYYLIYGGMQPVWEMLSDRLGRVRVIRLMLFAAAVAGGLFAAVIPASLVYIGDTVEIESRQEALADLMAASAVGTALATVFGGLAAYLEAWRLAFAALASVALAVMLIRLPEPRDFAAGEKEGPLSQVRRVLSRPWAVAVVGIALVEGAVSALPATAAARPTRLSSCAVCPAWQRNARKEPGQKGRARPTPEKPRGSPPTTSRTPTSEAAALDEGFVGRAHRVSVETFGGNLLAPMPLQSVVDTHHQRVSFCQDEPGLTRALH